ncbi:MAG: divergent polysaccharide deacetylase family protein [Gammaproteobacteria bacterium]|nr:divergent polysaccharide deacetylase family protein [Gammaproteobacteria bacterium]
MNRQRRRWLQALACAALPWSLGHAASAAVTRPRIALIIDDLGHALEAGQRVVRLPARVTGAVLPHTPHAARLAEAVQAAGHEVMLHLPMQPAVPGVPIGPGGIYLDTQRAELRETLDAALASVPHVVGVNNHMGSGVTRHPGLMLWLMEELADRQPLYWVDSRTTAETVAEQKAHALRVPALRRDVFLDHEATPEGVARQFARLQLLARARGSAVGIGHPYPVTLAFLEQALPQLARAGFDLVTPTELLLAAPARAPGA